MMAPDRDSEAAWPLGCMLHVLDEPTSVRRTLMGRKFAMRSDMRVTHLWLDGLGWVAVERARRVEPSHTETCATCAPGGGR